MRSIAAREARRGLHRLAADVEANDERVLLTRNGKPVAAMISAADLEYSSSAGEDRTIHEPKNAT